jgi:hypothetical protein
VVEVSKGNRKVLELTQKGRSLFFKWLLLIFHLFSHRFSLLWYTVKPYIFPISLKVRGITMVKLVTVLEQRSCPSCKGSGKNGAHKKCASCSGTGHIEVEVLRWCSSFSLLFTIFFLNMIYCETPIEG